MRRPRHERVRVLVDGAPATDPGALADAFVEPLRAAGRPVVRVSAGDFLRPASVRLEHGRHDALAYLEDWLDERALDREVLRPLGPDGVGLYLPTLWDAVNDRATRARYLDAAPDAVLVLDGSMLLGRGLPVDLSVHLTTRADTLARRTPADEHWTLEAYALYEERADPTRTADLVARVDDPRHPAIVT
nr:uridine kinase [Cellulomonas sp. JH27-2]